VDLSRAGLAVAGAGWGPSHSCADQADYTEGFPLSQTKERSVVTERILTLHPGGKQGVNIERAKYDAVKQAILEAIGQACTLEFGALPSAVEADLAEPFDGSIGWYTTTVKLDLEARGLIERVPGRSPQALRLTEAGESSA
jgi:hypothetical protein